MKIYSLQEENDKLNAGRGIMYPGIDHGMFDVRKTAADSRPQRKARTSAPQQRRMSSSVPQQRPAQPTVQRQRQLQQPPAPTQQNLPPRQGRRAGMLIGWFIFMLFLFLVSYLSEKF